MPMRGPAITALLLLATGCSSVGAEPADGCSYGGQVHAPGSSFPSTDGCNSCSCDAQGQVACTLVDCVGDGGAPSCTYEGATYPEGARFGPCNSCFCADDGTASCTFYGCPLDGGLPPFDGGVPVCTYNGMTYAPGSSFRSSDGCNSCGCGPTGLVLCTGLVCDDVCTLDATYTFGANGGLVAYVDIATLTPPGSYKYARTPAGNPSTPSASCMPTLPACRTDGAIDVANIMVDLSDDDVRRSFGLAQPPLYGTDSRPADGQVFEIKRSTGGSILVGGDCPATSSSCVPIPAGVAKLVADLRALNEQQLADPSCGTLR
jgi:hypothetical protein